MWRWAVLCAAIGCGVPSTNTADGGDSALGPSGPASGGLVGPPGDNDTQGPSTDTPASPHPSGFAAPDLHGLQAKTQGESCVRCHGETLEGTPDAPGCDTCHDAGWRSDCTFCHGDRETGNSAPPRHLTGVDEGLAARFIPHRAHTEPSAVHGGMGCAACHKVPTDVLTPGHVFVGDTTPGVAETWFRDGLAPTAFWEGPGGSCGSVYCHGSGRGPLVGVDHDITLDGCGGCHVAPGDLGRVSLLSGAHNKHMQANVPCAGCHVDIVGPDDAILMPGRHVDGQVDVRLQDGMSNSTGTCEGTCHGEVHAGRRW
jgi:hypothetical protein